MMVGDDLTFYPFVFEVNMKEVSRKSLREISLVGLGRE